MASGWISVDRAIADHWVWDCEFSTGQAWVDLLLHACHSGNKLMIKGQLITLQRGEQARSEVTLSAAWKWSRNKVRRFLKNLENDGMIEHKTTHLTSIISICNYNYFQVNDTSDGTSKRHLAEHVKDITRNTNNNVNNENNDQEKGIVDKSQKKPSRKKSEMTEFPDEFEITADMVTWFESKSFTIDLGQATDAWVDAMRAKGMKYKDWTAAWRTGMNNAQKWSKQ